MPHDMFGQPTTLTSDAARTAWNATQHAFLAHGAETPTHLAETLTLEPDFALGHGVKAMFYLLLGRRELMAIASEAVIAAQTAARDTAISARERLLIAAATHWETGDIAAAQRAFETVLSRHPDDTLTLKLDHALRFLLGDATGMRRMIETALPHYGPDHPGRGYVMGCHAFALEETGAYQAAKQVGQAALDRSPDDAWGLHAVAHVHDMTGDAAGGLAWLGGREKAWAHCNNFRYHVWWHKALMHLDQGQHDVVLALYDNQVRGDKTDDYRDISNATSLLMRLELEDVAVGDRWAELADLSAERTQDGCLIFADLHYILALAGDSRTSELGALMGRLHRDAKAQTHHMHLAMARPGLSAAAGLEAFGDGKYDIAFLNLAQARKTMQAAGGSHAQRDIFERMTIDAGIRAGYLDEAEAILSQRTVKRAGREDGYAAARRALIAKGRDGACAPGVPAE